MTVIKYKERTGEVISIDSTPLNAKDAKWYMGMMGIHDSVLGKKDNKISVKRKRGNVITETEFKWINNLETL